MHQTVLAEEDFMEIDVTQQTARMLRPGQFIWDKRYPGRHMSYVVESIRRDGLKVRGDASGEVGVIPWAETVGLVFEPIPGSIIRRHGLAGAESVRQAAFLGTLPGATLGSPRQ